MSARNRQFNFDITDTLQNPGSSFEVTAHDDGFPTEAFSREESQLFEQQLNDLVADMPSSIVGEILSQRQNAIAKVASLAKHDIDGNNFGGLNAGDNEIGFSVLRPGHIRRASGAGQNTQGNIVNDWYFEPNSSGYVDWIGDGSSNFVVNEDQVILVLGLVDQEPTPTPISGMDVEDFGRNMDMLPRDFNDLRLQDNDTDVQVKQMETLIGQEGDEVHMQLRYDRIVERQPRLLGFTFAKGRFLNTKDYDTTDYDNF